jgi:hypothetical protein
VIDPAAPELRSRLVGDGERVSQAYLPERVLPQWRQFLARLPGAAAD